MFQPSFNLSCIFFILSLFFGFLKIIFCFFFCENIWKKFYQNSLQFFLSEKLSAKSSFDSGSFQTIRVSFFRNLVKKLTKK